MLGSVWYIIAKSYNTELDNIIPLLYMKKLRLREVPNITHRTKHNQHVQCFNRNRDKMRVAQSLFLFTTVSFMPSTSQMLSRCWWVTRWEDTKLPSCGWNRNYFRGKVRFGMSPGTCGIKQSIFHASFTKGQSPGCGPWDVRESSRIGSASWHWNGR